MSDLVLHIGNKNYSSWSLRAWLALARCGVPFEEVLHPLGDEGERARVRQLSPAGRVPFLFHDDRLIWDSLAIGEHVAATWPEAGLWPADRAVARAVCSEMHAGFAALRSGMPMNIRRSAPGHGRSSEVDADIARITALWRSLRQSQGRGGDFLFGAFSLPDIFFAPVVARFRTYGVELDPTCQAYADAVWAWPDLRRWCEDARSEEWTLPQYDAV